MKALTFQEKKSDALDADLNIFLDHKLRIC